jgi:glycosyltransferase involved in cell wall biosynthesis
MILFLHNRYRTTGGEERVVEDLLWLVREHLGEAAELLTRDSAALGRRGNAGEPQSTASGRGGSARGRTSVALGGRASAALGLLRGGLEPEEVARAVRLGGARIVHAHNLHPAFGWRALAAARAAGARVVLHLHQYRLVCATGVCFTRGAECTRCHGRNTLPGVVLNCRGSRAEAITYGAALALWQRRLIEQADIVIVPSEFARARLRALGAPLPWERVHVLAPPLRELDDHVPGGVDDGAGGVALGGATDSAERDYALVVSRLAAEKGVEVAIDACQLAGVPLVVAGDGPLEGVLRARAREGAPVHEALHAAASRETPAPRGAPSSVRFLGRVAGPELARLRQHARVAIVPSRSAETFGMAAAEAMAAALPVAASRVGALPELVGEDGLATPGDAAALAEVITRLWHDAAAPRRSFERVSALCAPARCAAALADLYAEAEKTKY